MTTPPALGPALETYQKHNTTIPGAHQNPLFLRNTQNNLQKALDIPTNTCRIESLKNATKRESYKMRNYEFSVVLTDTYDFSEVYTVFDCEKKVIGLVSRCDSDNDDIFTTDVFSPCKDANSWPDCDFDNMIDAVKYLFDNYSN